MTTNLHAFTQTLLIVEDDPNIAKILKQCLEGAGYHLVFASTRAQAINHLTHHFIDLVLLDWMLAAENGIDIYRAARAHNQWRDIPFIILTARTSVEDQVYGLKQGVADYITKPFAKAVLLARIQSCLLRHPRQRNHLLGDDCCQLDITHNLFTTDKGQVAIDPSDCRILIHFLKHPNTPIARSKLAHAMTISNQHIESRTVDVHISRIRKRLAAIGEAWRVQTVRSHGYMLNTGTK